jgi:hypothetical protein
MAKTDLRKLTFILSKEVTLPKHGTTEIFDTATTWEEIETLVSKGFSPISQKHYLMSKALEFNEQFWDMIHHGRNLGKMPRNGLDRDEVLKVFPKILSLFREQKNCPPLPSELKYFELPKLNQENHIASDFFEQLILLGYGNYIGAALFPIERHIYSEFNKETWAICPAFHIKITRKISVEQIKQYLTENTEEIQKALDRLPAKIPFVLSERDLRICELRSNEKSYREIVEIIRLECPKLLEERISVTSVRKVFIRAQNRINALFKIVTPYPIRTSPKAS